MVLSRGRVLASALLLALLLATAAPLDRHGGAGGSGAARPAVATLRQQAHSIGARRAVLCASRPRRKKSGTMHDVLEDGNDDEVGNEAAGTTSSGTTLIYPKSEAANETAANSTAAPSNEETSKSRFPEGGGRKL